MVEEIKKVRIQGKQKVVTVPARSGIEIGDFVRIIKIEKIEEKSKD